MTHMAFIYSLVSLFAFFGFLVNLCLLVSGIRRNFHINHGYLQIFSGSFNLGITIIYLYKIYLLG